MAEIARVLIYGDIHLSYKDYGAHKNYAKESLDCFKKITELVEDTQATHLIGLGDLAYNVFNKLNYRIQVEEELVKQYKLVNGNRYEVKGNHDSASYGTTEYEYAVYKGLLKPSTNLQIGNVNISMVDYGAYNKTEILPIEEGKENIVLAHDYYKFRSTQMPPYGQPIILDTFTKWCGIDYLIVGHIHEFNLFKGTITSGDVAHVTIVNYLGSLSRPSYHQGEMSDEGQVGLLRIFDDQPCTYEIIDIELLPVAEAFNIEEKAEEKQRAEEKKQQRLNIADIVLSLNNHERSVGSPEEVIESKNLPEKVKAKALELLKKANM